MNRSNTKKQLVAELFKVVKMTRAGADIKDMQLDQEADYVIIQYEGGHKVVNVAADSGISLMRDVLRNI
ncbi:hypothetical protein AALB39_17975 [Lachnospiraceae bacterium 54-53]